MKKIRPSIWNICLLLIFLASPMYTVKAANEVSVVITAPSDQETKIAPRRSFYVRGTLAWTGNRALADSIEMTLTKSGESASTRVVGIRKEKIGMREDYAQLNYYADTSLADIKESKMPELVYDIDDVDSFNDPEKKAYFDDTLFNIFVAGGVDGETISDHAPYNPNTQPPLSEGNYTVSVQIKDPLGVVLGEGSKQIEIGVNEPKLISRFSPQSHLDNVTGLATQNGWRIFNDLFPGYWSFVGVDGSDKFVEILSQWRAANMEEFREGKVNFVAYNVSPTSATYGVELGMLQQMNHVNDTYLTNYHYQYGEPVLADGTTSSILAFGQGDKLELTRAEIGVTNSQDNMYVEADSKHVSTDLNVDDGVVADVGTVISLYGVVTPIQADKTDIMFDANSNVYTVNNKIDKIKYQLSDGAQFQTVLEKEVKLSRGTYVSELEFKHDIPITKEMEGKSISVLVVGYDMHGRLVPGTEETVQLAVTEETVQPQQQQQEQKARVPKTGDEGNSAGTMVILLLASVLVCSRVQRKHI